LPTARAFAIPEEPSTLTGIFQKDIAGAGIVYRDDDGRVADFHSRRHTFISNLARSGVHPKVAQSLAHHSTITLTMDRYLHTVIGEQADALRGLPDLTGPVASEVRKTGTDDRPGPNHLADCLAFSGRFLASQVDCCGLSDGEMCEVTKNAESVGSTAVTKQNAGDLESEGAGDRTQDQRIKSPNVPRLKVLSSKLYAPKIVGRCTTGRTRQTSDGGITDPGLAAMIAAWPTLPEAIKDAIMAIMGATTK
jgi:hypothetical protein